ncbi:cytochrome c oxidase subunit II [Pseudomonas sp. GX19020]|uniref:cytochrome c oxidase subunit II n=1 Tax=Pseudomonas sp. GX19020 TaxID=2942277 RepID=UPI0020187FC4|nr:cytochrome c oxidase subunit II [Pseudomonas sp. GX19020]MCL4067951.1 cytochrome c oxidase subunit II [Pseudomonas sp. GX19020]
MVPALAGCGGPLSTLSPQGPAAADIAALWWAMLTGATLITLLVLVLVWRGFARQGIRPPAESFWIRGMGLGFSFAVLIAVVSAGIWVGERIQARPSADVVRVEAIARQWSWRFNQPGPDGAMIGTEGRLYIPAGTPIDVVIRSDDVIHAFWVPQLAGKMDALPGRDNLLRIEASAPGLYHGTSAEFSGIGYAGMRFEVLAYDPASPPDFSDLSGTTGPVDQAEPAAHQESTP